MCRWTFLFRMTLVLLLLLLASHPGYAQLEFELVSDANTQPARASVNMLRWEGKVAFTQFTPAQGLELWVTDGTPTGTRLMCDVAPGPPSSSPVPLGVLNHKLLFSAFTQRYGQELWISDVAGTTATMLADSTPGLQGSTINALAVAGDKAWFTVKPADASDEDLWVTDGTPAGTRFVYRFNTMADRETVAYGIFAAGQVACILIEEHIYGHASTYRVWRSDGTAAGTYFLGVYGADTIYNSFDFLSTGDRLYYVSHPTPSTTSLLRTNADATAIETVCALDAIGGFNHMYFLNGTVYLSLTKFGKEDTALWKTDGTPQGTTEIKVFPNTYRLYSPGNLVAMGGQVYFTTYSRTTDSAGEQLWKTDGTPAGTQLVKQIHAQFTYYPIDKMVSSNGRVYFQVTGASNANELWVSDGTASGTVLLKERPAGTTASSYFDQLYDAGRCLVYDSVAYGSVTSVTLCRSDGTTSGTVPILDLIGGTQDGLPTFPGLASWGDRMVYSCSAGDAYGFEPWITDPVTGKGRMLKDIYLGPSSSLPWMWTPAGHLLYFNVSNAAGEEIWETDGTEANTRLYTGAFASGGSYGVKAMRFVNGRLFIFTLAGVYGKSDTGSAMVRLGNMVSPASPVSLGMVNGDILFNGAGDSGTELYKLDTQAKTISLVIDINPGAANSDPAILAEVPGGVFFKARDAAHGAELWFSDGTNAGTRLVKDCNPGSGDSTLTPCLAQGGVLYFGNQDPAYGNEPWCSDGTDAGTHMIADLRVGASSSNPSKFFSAGGHVLFTASNGSPLYLTDGTASGTRVFTPPARVRWPNYPTCFAVGNWFFGYGYSNYDQYRTFLWQSDGSETGTRKVYQFIRNDILYNFKPSTDCAVDSSGRIYIALTTERGKELWRTRLPLDAKAAAGTAWPFYR